MGDNYITTSILENGNLRLTGSTEALRNLAATKHYNEFQTDKYLWEFLSEALANPDFDYQQCDPAWVGALTSAPMLAMFEFAEKPLPVGVTSRDLAFFNTLDCTIERRNDGKTFKGFYYPVEQCWTFMDYALRSPLEDMLEQGYCDWQSGELKCRTLNDSISAKPT